MAEKIKVLNAFCCGGGNAQLWDRDKFEVTAIEIDPKIAAVYKDKNPQDIVIVGDAYEYIPKHYKEFKIIWCSPDCFTHSQFRYNCGVLAWGYEPLIPDMRQYGLIVFFQYNCKNIKWVVENVRPYYQPLIKPTAVLQRHFFWANFDIPNNIKIAPDDIRNRAKKTIKQKYEQYGLDLSKYKGINKQKILNNCVNSELGLHVIKAAFASLITEPSEFDSKLCDIFGWDKEGFKNSVYLRRNQGDIK